MRDIPIIAIDFVKRFEGCKLTRYIDACGFPTIGIGHLCHNGDNLFEITEEEAEGLLHTDLQIAGQGITRLIDIPLNDNQYTALISFVYNLGSGILQASTLRKVINRGDFEDVPEQFERWIYGGARKLPGLIARRKAEAQLFEA
jgi:lysozyme